MTSGGSDEEEDSEADQKIVTGHCYVMLTSCCSHTLTLSVHSVSDEMYVHYTTRKFSSQSIHAQFVNIPCFQLYTSSCSPILIVMKKHPKTETANFCF